MSINFPDKYRPGLQRVIAAIQNTGPELSRRYPETLLVATSVQTFLRNTGVEVSLGQAEEIYSLYSCDKFAGWITFDTDQALKCAALSVIALCESVQEGENHVGL